MYKIGEFTQKIIDLLGVDISSGTPIMIGNVNIEHIKNRHIYEYDKYMNQIEDIIATPDYVGINPKDNSIGFVKLFKVNSEYIRVAVRISTKGQYIAKSLHMLSTCNAERYIEKGTLIKVNY